jgi:rubrerythrin
LFELRAAQIYQKMAERFADVPAAHRLFKDFQEEEVEHARLMLVCLYSVRMTPDIHYVPSVRDPEIKAVMQAMRRVQRRVAQMTLEEALDASEELERGEVNVIFGRLLKQVEEPEIGLLRQMIRHAEGHQDSVPRRIRALREALGLGDRRASNG